MAKGHRKDRQMDFFIKNLKKIIVLGIIFIAVLIVFFNSFVIVSTGETGVLIRFGQVQAEALTEGFHFKIPFADNVRVINNKQTEISYEGQVWAESADQTPVYYENVVISYQIAPSASVWLYSNVDRNIINDGRTLITPTLVSSAIKNASVTLPTRQVTNRGSIEPLAAKELQASVDEKYGAGNVTIIKLSISNADFEDAYNAVIAERQSAQIKQEQQEIENQTAIARAEAEAEAARLTAQGEAAALEIREQAEANALEIRAQAEANAIKIEAEAQAEANKKILESLEEEILISNYIEKWNGELPMLTGSDNGLIIDINSLLEDAD